MNYLSEEKLECVQFPETLARYSHNKLGCQASSKWQLDFEATAKERSSAQLSVCVFVCTGYLVREHTSLHC